MWIAPRKTKNNSAVGTVAVKLSEAATGGTVGTPVTATASITEGATPAGQLTFKAFAPGDANCSGSAAFTAVVAVAGNGSYSSSFVPARIGSFRWAVSYSGDVNHSAAAVGCGGAASGVTRATPLLTGSVSRRLVVGKRFRVRATLAGGYSPGGTITFKIYGPVAKGCPKPLAVDIIAVSGNDTFRSDPFVAKRPGRYSFVASYSGDGANREVTAPCDAAGQVARVQKRKPKVKPRSSLSGRRRILIRARLLGATSPSGRVYFRLFRPGDRRCKHKPAFSGGIDVSSNGTVLLAKYLATHRGLYRLEVGYSGDARNKRYLSGCRRTQRIRVR